MTPGRGGGGEVLRGLVTCSDELSCHGAPERLATAAAPGHRAPARLGGVTAPPVLPWSLPEST